MRKKCSILSGEIAGNTTFINPKASLGADLTSFAFVYLSLFLRLPSSQSGNPHRGSDQRSIRQEHPVRDDPRSGGGLARGYVQRRHISHLAAGHRGKWNHCQAGADTQTGSQGPTGWRDNPEEDT